MKQPTLQTIADAAGVSKMTVSRALRNHPHCGKAIKVRVEEIARELNYRKHPLVSALMTDLRYKKEPRFKTIIALLSFGDRGQPSNPNQENMSNGIRETAADQGYNVEEFYLGDEGMTPKRMLGILTTRGIRGIIFRHSQQPNIQFDVDLTGFACVAIKYSLEYPVLHRVESSHFGGILKAVDKIGEYGYRSYGLVVLGFTEKVSQFRRSGATLVAQSRLPEDARVPILETRIDDTETLKAWLETYKPEVVMSQSKDLYQVFLHMGYKIPRDFGFVHLGISDRTAGLAGIDPNWKEMGRIAANQIVDQFNRNELGIPEYPTVTLVQGDWVDGESLPRRQVLAS